MKHVRLLCKLLPCLFLFAAVNVSYAQVSVYGAVALTDYVFFNDGRSTQKSASTGFIGGASYDFPIHSRMTAGLDARGIYSSSGTRGGGSGLVFLRFGFVPEHVVFRPYLEVGGGVVSSKVSTQITGAYEQGITTLGTRYTNGAGGFDVGLDVRLSHSVDLRAIEFGAVADGSNSKTTVGSSFLDAGLVYHFHQRPWRN